MPLSFRQPVSLVAFDHHTDTIQLLNDWRAGDRAALAELMRHLEHELRKVARGHLRRERRDHTLQTTALVNEAYLRLVNQRRTSWQSRAHFLAIAASMMRRILVDYAKRRSALKRGGDQERRQLPLSLSQDAGMDFEEILALHEALERLEEYDQRQARIVELRYFSGMNNEEIVEVLGVSLATVKRDWCSARAWLHRELRGGDSP